ncbi:hypothetical protein Hanom_Chr12g01138031 [Helianthus anomalus]
MPLHEHHFSCGCTRGEDFQYNRRSLGCCRFDLATTTPSRRHLRFYTVGCHFKFLDVAVTGASYAVV